MPTIVELVDEGIRYHTAGQLEEAEKLYRQVLEREPENPAALHLLGVSASQQGRHDTAVQLIQRAIAANPNIAEFHCNLALVYIERGEPDRAIASAQNALAIKPDYPDAFNHLGNGLKHTGRIDVAIEAYHRALRINPNHADSLNNLSDAYVRSGRFAEAEEMYDKLLRIKPNQIDALVARGELFRRHRKNAEAIAVCTRALAVNPAYAPAHNTLGAAYHELGKMDEAIAAYKSAIAATPGFAGAHSNLGFAYHYLGRFDEAMTAYQMALLQRPDMPEIHNNIGNLHRDLLRIDESIASYSRGLFFVPNHTDCHWNRSLAYLLLGDFERGWPDYEWRWLNFPKERRDFRQPLWNGDFDISGKTILLHAEQGLGDTLQFIRFAPLVAAKGAIVNVECQQEMEPLFRRLEGINRVITRGNPLPPFDCHCPLLTLAYALRIKLDALPGSVPYLTAHVPVVSRWKEKLEPYKKNFKVGLSWGGSPVHRRDRERSMSLHTLAPLANIENVVFISLQKGDPAREAKNPPAGMNLVDFSADLHDFGDTAALMENLDLVIGVDTAVVHLAGALAKKVFTLVTYNPDWRWLLDCDDSPWYPTMTVFRQLAPRDWSDPIAKLAEKLRELAPAKH